MINKIKIDHTKPVWVNVWNSKGNNKNKRIYLFSFNDIHYCIDDMYTESFLSGGKYDHETWYYIEFIKPKKLIPLDAKSCPRRPALTHHLWEEGSEIYPSILELGLKCSDNLFYPWETLFIGGYMINGLPASREVDE